MDTSQMQGTETERRMHAAAEVLARLVLKHAYGKRITLHLLGEVTYIVQNHRTKALNNGLSEFPELLPLPLVKQGRIELVRRDLDLAGVQQTIVNITVKHPKVTAQEVAFGVNYVWPWYAKHIDASARRDV